MYLRKKITSLHKLKMWVLSCWESLHYLSFLLWQNSGLTNLPVNMRSKFTTKFLHFVSEFTTQYISEVMKQTPRKFRTGKNLNLNLYNFQKLSFLPNSSKLYMSKLCLHILFSNSHMFAFTIKQSKQCNFHPPSRVWLLYVVAFIIPGSQLQ